MSNDFERALGVLDRCSTLSLATAAGCAPLFYVRLADSLALYWISSDTSAHSRALVNDPSAAVAIYPATQDWRTIEGIQMSGTAVRCGERDAVVAAYRARFNLGPEFDVLIGRASVWVFTPVSMRYIDSSQGVGWRREWTISGGTTADSVPS